MTNHSLTQLQLAIMDVLWTSRDPTLADIHDRLRADRDIAQSTVATLLYRMEDKGVIERWQDDRRYRYRPIVTRESVQESVVSEFSDRAGRLFAGDAAGLVSCLIDAADFDAEQLQRAKELIAARQNELEEGP